MSYHRIFGGSYIGLLLSFPSFRPLSSISLSFVSSYQLFPSGTIHSGYRLRKSSLKRAVQSNQYKSAYKCNCKKLFSPLDKPADRAIYFTFRSLFFFLSFFTRSKAISVSTGPIFTIFSPNVRYLREFSYSGPVFPIPQGTLPWQLILCRKQNTNHVQFLQFFYHIKGFWV